MSATAIKIGDQVRFMNEVGGGRVTAILSKDLVNVETKDGFEIPTYIKNLVVIEPELPRTSRQSSYSAPAKQPNPSTQYPEIKKGSEFKDTNQFKGNDFPEFIFAALPDNPGNPPEGKILLYLVNDCNFTLLYHFATKMADSYTTVDAGMLEPNTKVELETISPKAMGEMPEYCFQLLFFKKTGLQLEEPVQKEIRISPVKFFKASSFVKNNYFTTPALLIRLAENPLKAEMDKLTDRDFQQVTLTKEPKKPAAAEMPKSDLVEIDLHINQLLDDTRGLSNADMIKLQLDTFRKEMDHAIATGVKKIVFIHGVGDGVLKNELRRELQRKYARYPFQDASFREYGFGATMAVLRK
ncbi:MAG: DUF2027 domain-containing protein [Prolixibacteraceae bacterium]